MKTPPKLVLFDIDGTLVHGSSKGVAYWKDRVKKSIEEIFEITLDFELDITRYNGTVDRFLFGDIARRANIEKAEFDAKFPRVRDRFHFHLKTAIERGDIVYTPIEDAKRLALVLIQKKTHHIGVITGNIEINGRLKLISSGLEELFPFGAFADDVEDRTQLANLAYTKAKTHFGYAFSPEEVVVIGDTVHDVRCGKAIGARTIAVTTGVTGSLEGFAEEAPDALVDSLMDERVLSLLDLM